MNLIVPALGFLFGALVFGYVVAGLQRGRIRLRQVVIDRGTHPQPFWLCVGIGLVGSGLIMAVMGLRLVLAILG
jgi:hypothetical protein